MNYSIIIPHKNVPKLLFRALKSIPLRSDIEIIVIDDNSDKPFLDSIEELKIKFQNVNFISTKTNKGAGYCRNIGISNSNGKWLLFMDSDDFFSKNAFDFFDEYKDSKYDVIFFQFDSYFSDSMEIADRHSEYCEIIDNYLSDNKIGENSMRFRIPVPYAKLIRKKLVMDKDLKFDEIIASNDVMFSAKLGSHASTVSASDKIVYSSTVRRGSLTKTRTKEVELCRYQVQIKYNLFMKEIGFPSIQKHITSRLIDVFFLFGLKEFIKYVKLARKSNVSLFSGLHNIRGSFIKRLLRKLTPDKYVIR